jgi:peptidoglycan/xylan/chitin deacetylase (PgdA/CDA1 family)
MRSSNSKPLVLMYHGVPPASSMEIDAESFEQQIAFLKQQGEFVHPEELESGKPSPRRKFLLTFDDGYRNNADVVAPILRRHNVPAVFFVSTRHCVPGKYLWFTYLRMLATRFSGEEVSIEDQRFSLRGPEKEASLARLRGYLLGLKPHPQAIYEAINRYLPPLESFVGAETIAAECGGMTVDQIKEMASDPLFTIGGHTVDHPNLTSCTESEAESQIVEGKRWFERVTGKSCDLFAYPSADFNERVVQQCRHAGFARAFGVYPNHLSQSQFAIPRVGIYAKSLMHLRLKLWYGVRSPNRVARQVYALWKSAEGA